jgi:hypothetical protein
MFLLGNQELRAYQEKRKGENTHFIFHTSSFNEMTNQVLKLNSDITFFL